MATARLTTSTSHGALIADDSGGRGLPVLLIHGSGSSRQVFARQMQSELARQLRLIAIDLPGHGQSQDAPDPMRTYGVTGLADCLGEAMDKFGVRRFAVYGWSLGGHVALQMLATNPNIAGVMISGAPPVQAGTLGMLRGFHPSLDLLLASREVYSQRDIARFEALCFGQSAIPAFGEAIARADGRLRNLFVKSLSRGEGADQRRTFENADVPVAIVQGARDPFVRLSYIAGLDAPMLLDGHINVIPGAGHAPFWERPDVFNPILRHFIRVVVAHERPVEADLREIA